MALSSTPSDRRAPHNDFQRPLGWFHYPMANEIPRLYQMSMTPLPLSGREEATEATMISNCSTFDHLAGSVVSEWNLDRGLSLPVYCPRDFLTTQNVGYVTSGRNIFLEPDNFMELEIPNQGTLQRGQSGTNLTPDGYQNLFATFEEALAYIQSSKHSDQLGDSKPEEDCTVAEIEQNCQDYVRMIYAAMINVEGVQDMNTITIGHFSRNSPRYETSELEATAWVIVKTAIDLHRIGRTFHKRWDKSHRILQHVGVADVSLTCAERLEEVRILLAESKSTVEMAIDGNVRFVNHPRYHRQTLWKNRRTRRSTETAGRENPM